MNQALRRLSEIDARAAAAADPPVQADVVCLVRLLTRIIAMHGPAPDGRRCAECAPQRLTLRRRRPAALPCRTRWLIDVVLGSPPSP